MQPPHAPTTPLPDSNALCICVQSAGWFKSTVARLGYDLHLHTAAEAIAGLLGRPIEGRAGQTIEPLAPRKRALARAKSLSVVHGLGSFPMHTDGAHRLQPPRFIVL